MSEKTTAGIFKKLGVCIAALMLAFAMSGLVACGDSSDEGASTNSTTSEQPTAEAPEEEKEAEEVPVEYQNALEQAQTYSDVMCMSKKGIHDQLTSEYGGQFDEDAADYAVEHVDADWNANALAKAKTYQEDMNMSKAAIKDQLTSEYGEQFTEKQAEYAIEHLDD